MSHRASDLDRYFGTTRATRKDEIAGHVTRMGEMRNAYNILVGKPEGKRPQGRPRHRWEHNMY
jgi:hypothetical protein